MTRGLVGQNTHLPCSQPAQPATHARGQTQRRHLRVTEKLADMNEWVKKIRSSVHSVVEGKRRKSTAPSAGGGKTEAMPEPEPEPAPVMDQLPPVQQPQLTSITKQRARGPPRRRPTPHSQLQARHTVWCAPTADDDDPARHLAVSSCRDLVYEYSSSDESDGSEKSTHRSVAQRLNTTMPEIATLAARRSTSPAGAPCATSSASIYQQRAAGPSSRAVAPCLSRRKRSSVPSMAAPQARLEKEFGGGSSTGSSSLSNLTSTLTREGQMLPALIVGLERASSGLNQVAARVASLGGKLTGTDRSLTDARADMARLQDHVTSLQIMVTGTSGKMVAFAEMFQTVDEQLQDMWTEMDTVNSNVHHVMHKALEQQRQNERLFSQLATMRDQLLGRRPVRVGAPEVREVGQVRRVTREEAADRRTVKAAGIVMRPTDTAGELARGPAQVAAATVGAPSATEQGRSVGQDSGVTAVDDPLSSTLVI